MNVWRISRCFEGEFAMRRAERATTDKFQIINALEEAKVVHLGMIDQDRPYVVPMHYGYEFIGEHLVLYLHSAKAGRKIDILKNNEKVFVELICPFEIVPSSIPCNYTTAYFCVMADGKASFVNEVDKKKRALELLVKVQGGQKCEISDRMTDLVEVIRIDTEDLIAKVNRK